MKGLEIVRYLRGALPLDVGVIYTGNVEFTHGVVMKVVLFWMDATRKGNKTGMMLLPFNEERSKEQMSDLVESFLNSKQKIDTAPRGTGH
jgi:hypothetical protein